MQVAQRASSRVAARKSVPVRSSVRVVCQAQSSVSEVAKKVAAVATSVSAAFVASPAFALVDERLNGDGTGLPLGVNDSAIAFHMLLVFFGIYGAFVAGTRDLGSYEDEESGLRID